LQVNKLVSAGAQILSPVAVGLRKSIGTIMDYAMYNYNQVYIWLLRESRLHRSSKLFGFQVTTNRICSLQCAAAFLKHITGAGETGVILVTW